MTRNQVPVPDAPQICIKKHTHTHLFAEITQKQKTHASIFRCSERNSLSNSHSMSKFILFFFAIQSFGPKFRFQKAPTSLQTSFYTFPAQFVCPVVCFVQEQYFVRRRSEGKILREVALSAPPPWLAGSQ